MMKKVISIFFIFILSFSLWAQKSSAITANRNTALRCLKLAENCIVGGDWENALKQAELGLSYDENISDLIYLKAAALINLGKSKAEVLEIIASAFEKNDWVGYSKNGARILYADLLSDTGMYDDSMSVLDDKQMIYSADAEFIRVKNLYRMGTEASINSARLKLNSARRIYPADSRFPNLFFMFEFVYLVENSKANNAYEIPDIVRNISAFYIKNLPDYSGQNLELELLASFFAEPEEQNRLINAINAKNQTENPVLALAGLKIGLYDDQQAFDLFFEMSGDELSLEYLQFLVNMLTDENVKYQLMEKMLNYQGTIVIDENFDLQNELIIEYELGRPKSVKYDRNNDGIVELYSTCDFGAPQFIYFNAGEAELFYDSYPSVSKISFVNQDYVLSFLHDDLHFSPFRLIPDSYLQRLGLDLYIPYVEPNLYFPAYDELVSVASSLEMPLTERIKGKVVYSLAAGVFVNADFYEDDVRYGYCDFTTVYPIVRVIDSDLDGYFETEELYDVISEKTAALHDADEIEKSFGVVLKDYPLYLYKIRIDRNGNTFHEFTEQYLENEGKISNWDNDDDGIIDCQYVRYPKNENDSLIEETTYFNGDGKPLIRLNTIDGVPVKMFYSDSEVIVYAGSMDNLYWIDENGDSELEKHILKECRNGLVQGKIDIVEYEDTRIGVICVGKSLYCKILPASDFIEEENPNEVTE